MSTRILAQTAAILLTVLCAVLTSYHWFPAAHSVIFSSGSFSRLFQSTGQSWLLMHAVIVSCFIVLQISKTAWNFDAKSLEGNLQSFLVFLALASTAWTFLILFLPSTRNSVSRFHLNSGHRTSMTEKCRPKSTSC